MSIWRYENYGTASLLKISGNTVTGLSADKSKTGSAFWQNQRVAAFPIPATKELWVKFDLYYGNAQWRAYDRLNGNDTGVGRYQQANTITSFINGPLQYQLNPPNTLTVNQLKTYLLHMVSDAENGLVELWVDGVKYYSDDFASEGLIYKGNVEGGADFDNFYLQSASSANLFSNVIISNARIGLGENVIGQGLSSYLDFDIVRDVKTSSLHVSINFDTVREVNPSRFPLTLNFDIARNIWHSWRYENYGVADTLLPRSNVKTVLMLPVTKSKTGSAFQTTTYSRLYPYSLPETYEIWIKFDVYAPYKNFAIYNFNYTRSGIDFRVRGSHDHWIYCYNYNSSTGKITSNFDGIICTCLIHMKAGLEDGIIELWLNGESAAVYEENINGNKPFDNICISAESGTLFSNLIISNAPIGFDEDADTSLILLSPTFDLVRNVNSDNFPLSLLFDSLRIISQSIIPVTFTVDFARYLNINVWRYENFGTGDLLLIDDVETVELPIEFSKTGYAYVLPTDSTNNHFDITPTDEIWIKFDFAFALEYSYGSVYASGFYVDLGNGEDYIRIDATNLTGWLRWRNSNASIKSVNLQNFYAANSSSYYTKLHSVWIHVSENHSELWFDAFYSSIDFGVYVQSIKIWNSSNSTSRPRISNVIISNSPVRIFEDVSAIIYPRAITFDVGAYRDVINTPNVWRYENFGTDELLEFETQTFTDLPASQSKTGSAFVQYDSVNPCFKFSPSAEVWLQFDVYTAESKVDIYAGLPNFNIVDSNGRKSFTGGRLVIYLGNYNFGDSTYIRPANYNYRTNITSTTSYTDFDSTITSDTLATCLIHLKTGVNGNDIQDFMEFWINGFRVGDSIGNLNGGNAIEYLTLFTDSDKNVLFSNVIISNVNPNLKILQADLCRVLYADLFVLLADTARTLSHNVFSAPIESFGDVPDFHQSCNGLQQFEIRISEQQITDLVTYTTTNPVNILEQVNGHFLDYKFNMRIESLQQRGILYSCNCCNDIDELLYTQIEYKVPEDEKWHWADGSPEVYGSPDSTFHKPEDVPPAVEASVHVAHIAEVLNKNYVIQFDDFVSTVDGDSGGVTYNDLIRSIFGWSSRIPHKLINCYIRDDTLFVVQRGHEQNIIDLSNSTFEIVSRDKSLMRTFWGNSLWSKTETRSEHIGWRKIYDKDDYKTKNSQNGNANYSYDNSGLVTQTSIYNDDGSTTYIDYQYTELSNGRKVLSSESHSTYKDGERIDYQHIQHTYLNQGQSHVMATGEDGDYLGSDVGQSIGDDRVTPWDEYTSRVIQSVYKDKERTIYGLTNFDSSFPIDGDKKLKEITADIIWLNRKTQEIITINLYDFPHVIDFNDRLIVNGNEFFLKSNVAVQTPRIVNKQTLQLVRWY